MEESKPLEESAASGDRGAALRSLRDLLARTIQTCDSARDIAALSRQLTDVLNQLESLPKPAEGTPLDELANRRRGSGAPRPARTKRQPQRPG